MRVLFFLYHIILIFAVKFRRSFTTQKTFLLLGTFLFTAGIIVGCSSPDNTNTDGKQKIEDKASASEDIKENDQSKQNEPELKNEPESKNETPVPGEKAKVISVTDGDTIKVQLANGLSEKVRLILVDTPETKHPRLGVQPFGKEASAFTTKELTGKDVVLELDVEQRDRYGRLLAYVWVGDNLYNERLIAEGLARVAVFPPNTKYVDRFRDVQKKAQAAGIGIWSIEDYARENGYNSEGTQDNSPASDSNSGGSYVNDPSDDQETNLGCKGKIKGNANSKIYHVPGGSYYDSLSDNVVWFCSEAEAEAAGYRKSKR